jgi:hypothetical protein
VRKKGFDDRHGCWLPPTLIDAFGEAVGSAMADHTNHAQRAAE